MNLNQPTVGARGLWKLSSPYDTLLPINTALTCTAISNYGQLESMGIDTFKQYYQNKSIDKTVYTKHIDEEGRIVFLKDSSGQIYSFPLHYLVEYPIGTGVGYQSTALFVRLGALPLTDNLTQLITKIQDIVTDELGIKSHVEAAAISNVIFINNDEHKRILEARKSLKKESKPTLTQLTEALAKVKDLTKKLELSERRVIQLDTENKELKEKRG